LSHPGPAYFEGIYRISIFTPASSTTKTGRHDIAEILLKVALKHQKSNQINQICKFHINSNHVKTDMFQNASSLKPNCPGMTIGRSSVFLCQSEIQDGCHHKS
jgi:hypothetical protein